MKQFNPVHNITTHVAMMYFNITVPFYPKVLKWYCPLTSSNQNYFLEMHAACPYHNANFTTLTLLRVHARVMKK